MTVTTHVNDALGRVQREQEHVSEKQSALDRFCDRVREVPAGSPRQPSATSRATAGGTASAMATYRRSDSSADRCRRVCEAFAETVAAAGLADGQESESLSTALRTELGDDVALALAPGTDGVFTPDVKQAVLAAATRRRTELRAMERALATEADSLRTAAAELDEVTDWLARTDETPLLELGFEALRERHETLTRHRARCERLARDRQRVLNGTTSHEAAAGVSHRALVASLYDGFPTDHPVLATVARLDGVCDDCQRAVRDHLTRRV
ncbi:DUF7260 family protein [Halomicrococcus gelatinilyticus]|uniref:DUF7260 family protein n=1 Tax=Halomicrococcus gelatinilyticus TaxID=1702103 RepID=UPI002E13B9F0